MFKCDKCGSDKVVVVSPKVEEPKLIKMTEMSAVMVVPAIYKITTLKCEDCGFKHSF